MIIKKRDKKNAMNKLLLVGFILTGLLSLFLLRYVAAQEGGGGGDNETFQSELNNLTQYLTEQGYEWLVNYSIENNTQASIEVYRENDNEVIAVINDISRENWYKTYLSGGDASGGGAGWKDYFKLNEKAENEKPKNL